MRRGASAAQWRRLTWDERFGGMPRKRTDTDAPKQRPRSTAASDPAPTEKPTKKPRPNQNTAKSTTPTADDQRPVASEPPDTVRAAFPIVGIGASAGGLEAYRRLLQALPMDTGAAFVLVQHLDPTHASMLAEILSRATRMPVREVHGQQPIEPNSVFVIPPGRSIVLSGDLLTLLPREETRAPHRPVDTFLRSLAESRHHSAIGVVLSGTGNDGTQGLEAIKAEGGITFAQDETAQQDGMPRSAISAGCVDFVLPPEAIARELARIGHHLHTIPAEEASAQRESTTAKIMRRLRDVTSVDFSNYRFSTIYRRIRRRMLLHELEKLSEYLRLLDHDVGEVNALYQDILIGVTSFFRDPEACAALVAKAFPKLTQNRERKEPIRMWVPGCASGEEAYSLAMAFTEYAGEDSVPVQMFGTDLNDEALNKARIGLYPQSIVSDVSPERLRRFFSETTRGYQVRKSIRDMCVFAHHNVLADPPFSRMDLIACRNLLIYLEPVLQNRLFPLFRHALNPNGFLWLGTSESAASVPDLFEVEDTKYKLYSKRPTRAKTLPLPMAALRWEPMRGEHARAVPAVESPIVVDVQREADRVTLAKYAPAAVLVNASLEILQFRGDTGPYLSPAPGKPSNNLLKMAREGLLIGLRSLAQRALREGSAVREEGLKVRVNGGTRAVNLEMIPVPAGPASERCFLVIFEEARPATGRAAARQRAPKVRPARRGEAEKEVTRLTQELAATRDYLQSLVEQQEAANEELQSANEEVQSTNEELQSVNEELQTSKEEIQSTNEELTTVNEELRNRNELLAEANADVANILSSTRLGLIVIDRDLRLRRFTPEAEKLFSLIPADVGRPIADLRLALDVVNLEAKMTEVIRSDAPHEEEVRDKKGHWYSLRLRPYKNLDNKLDGVVIVLVNVDAQKRAQMETEESEHRFRLIADSAPVFIWINGPTGREYVNRTYLEYLGVGESDALGPDWAKFVHPDDRAGYMAAYQAASEQRTPFKLKFRLRRADGRYRWMDSAGVPRLRNGGELVGYVGSTYDIDDLMTTQGALQSIQKSLEAEVSALNRLHELSGQLMQEKSLDSFLASIIDAAVEITGAEFGNVQLFDHDSGALRIAVSRGFEKPFLDFFASVSVDDPAACGTAMRRGERVVVEDVTKSDIFAGTPALDVELAAGVRAVQSTPLITRSGEFIGMFSTHYRSTRKFGDRDLRLLDMLARQAADAIERHKTVEKRDLARGPCGGKPT